MDQPFPRMELQTTGVFLSKTEEFIDENTGKVVVEYPNIRYILDGLHIDTVSLSVFDIFDDEENMRQQGTPKHLHFKLKELIDILKKYNINVRLSINMTSLYDEFSAEEIFARIKELGVHQITFRKLYHSDKHTPRDEWVKENSCEEWVLDDLNDYITAYGKARYFLPYGNRVWSIDGMSTVIDDDCMNKNNEEVLKYAIIRENGKMYCQWDDEGSLIF